jgi:hypothetical protein
MKNLFGETVPSLVKAAFFSPDRHYRYWLTRHWGLGKRVLCFVLLNPSTATEEMDDPTIRLCIGWAKRLGFDGMCVVNLFAIRSPSPAWVRSEARRGEDIVGPDNDFHTVKMCKAAAMVICAWGNNGSLQGRADHIKLLLKKAGVKPYCLKLSGERHPVHPLYQPYSLTPILMEKK